MSAKFLQKSGLSGPQGGIIMTIKPLADRVVVKLVEAEEKTKTGIVKQLGGKLF